MSKHPKYYDIELAEILRRISNVAIQAINEEILKYPHFTSSEKPALYFSILYTIKNNLGLNYNGADYDDNKFH